MLLGLLKSITRTTSFIGKEITEVVRRPGALLSLVLGPFLVMGLFGLGYSGQYQPLNTIVVLPPDGTLRRDPAFYQEVAGSAVRVVQVATDAQAARAQLAERRVDLVVILPANVEGELERGRRSSIVVEFNQLDPVRDNYARFVAERQVQELNRIVIEQAVGSGLQYATQTLGYQPTTIPPQVVAAPLRPEVRNLAPVQPSVVAYFAPAVLALVLQHMGVTLAALSMVRERLSGAIDIFRVAPVRSVEILVGKYLAFGFLNLAAGVLVTLLLIGPLGVPMLGSPQQLGVVIALLTFASLGLGLLISIAADSERQAVQLAMLVLLASVFFSGFVLPLEEFRPAARLFSYALPVTHGIQLLQDTMLRGASAASWESWALGGIGVALFFAAALGLRRVMDHA